MLSQPQGLLGQRLWQCWWHPGAPSLPKPQHRWDSAVATVGDAASPVPSSRVSPRLCLPRARGVRLQQGERCRIRSSVLRSCNLISGGKRDSSLELGALPGTDPGSEGGGNVCQLLTCPHKVVPLSREHGGTPDEAEVAVAAQGGHPPEPEGLDATGHVRITWLTFPPASVSPAESRGEPPLGAHRRQ